MRLDGKVVLITGASEGIGAACAKAFRERGAQLSLTARSREKLESAGGESALVTAGDITDAAHRALVVERTVERFGRIDVLVNNAGVGLYAPSWCVPASDVRAMMELNFFAPLAMIQLVAPHMRRQKSGTIVNVGSIAGKVTLPWFTLYSASKYALGSLTDGLRMELKRDGVHAITVCPGYVDTGFHDHALAGRPPKAIRRGKTFAITSERCARDIVRGVERGRRTVVTPGAGWVFIVLERLFPSLVDRQLEKIYHAREQAA